MMWLTENIQACLRIFRQLQHLWLVRDICIKRKGFIRFMSSTQYLQANPFYPFNPW